MKNFIIPIAMLSLIFLALLVQIARRVNWLYETEDVRGLLRQAFKWVFKRKSETI